MTVEEIEEILEAGKETQKVDYKESCPWDTLTFVKDILAMANTQDGGMIVIGMKESGQTFTREGVLPEHKATFKIDVMKDKVGKYADPYVYFDVDFPTDKNGLEYIVISVSPFDKVPVICKKDGKDSFVTIGSIYHRGFNRRAESTRVSSYFDMREIIERATVKMMQHFEKLELKPSKTIEDKLKSERGDL